MGNVQSSRSLDVNLKGCNLHSHLYNRLFVVRVFRSILGEEEMKSLCYGLEV